MAELEKGTRVRLTVEGVLAENWPSDGTGVRFLTADDPDPWFLPVSTVVVELPSGESEE